MIEEDTIIDRKAECIKLVRDAIVKRVNGSREFIRELLPYFKGHEAGEITCILCELMLLHTIDDYKKKGIKISQGDYVSKCFIEYHDITQIMLETYDVEEIKDGK